MTGNAQRGLFPHPHGEQHPLPLPPDQDGDAAPHPLDVAQEFTPATPYDVREELVELVRRDLLGPWDGEHEEFRPGVLGPSERYLVGRLGPKQTTGRPDAPPGAPPEIVPEIVPDVDAEVRGDATETDLPEVLTPQGLGKLWASSMGLSFAVPREVTTLAVTATWGRYHRRETQDGDGAKRTVWAREPVSHAREVKLDGRASDRLPLTGTDPDQPGVLLAVDVRVRDGRRVVRVALVNTQLEPERDKDVAWLFQPALAVTARDRDAAAFLPIDDPEAAGGDAEETHLRLLYRSRRRYAIGHNVSVHPYVRGGEPRAYRLETDWMPTCDVPVTIAPVGEGTPLAGVELSMDALATAGVDALRAGLAPLVDGYLRWLADREAETGDLPVSLRAAAEAAVFNARRAAARIRAGIELLATPGADRHDQALAAFRFANEAMALQRRHTEIARLREETGLPYQEAQARVAGRGAQVASWRPFQLAFVLLNLPSLTDPRHPERAADHDATVDLLFFPTGGGKTEAYLGLTAFTFAVRRLQGTVGTGERARSGAAGTAVLMRYTLRLLTAQQFQRAAALVCAAEVLRRRDPARWGDEPFRIGLWVGGAVSPNWYDEAAAQIAEAREAGHGRRTNVLQTLVCPWCGTRLRPHHDLHPRDDLRRVLLWCGNGEGPGACPFSRTRGDDGLPILTVDEEIYRYAPSLVVATVDKLAQLPWNGYGGILFGRVEQRCPRHGYRHADMDGRVLCGSRHQRKGALPAVTSQPVARLRPPDLIVQDELHLISGALGTTVGLFEAAVDQLCTWSPGAGHDTGPKIVASTATTKRAAEQVLGVFGRGLAVFPPPVTDIADTFFSRQVPVSRDHPGRRYLGICANGVRLKFAEIRLAEILLLAGQTLFDRYGAPAGPYLTMVNYFNATRELAGMRRALDDQVTIRLRSHGRRRGLSDRIVSSTRPLAVQELTSRVSSADISDVLSRLEIGFDPDLDTTARRRAVNAEIQRSIKQKAPAHPLAERYTARSRQGREPVDVVLATSMLQVGVDVPRLGLMVVTGQPKNTAEYIQATSRVGRVAASPGLVVTLYHWTRPRDLAHYEDFGYYHATFYRQVEALSVTPYTRRSLDRGAAATFIAAVRHAESHHSRDTDAHHVTLDSPPVRRVVDRLLARAEAVAGDRARGYLSERIGRIIDRWNERRTGTARLAYRQTRSPKEQLTPLLERAGGGTRWTDLTVAMSMRETENEINLLVPGGGDIFHTAYGAPPWSPAGPAGDLAGEVAGSDEDDLPAGDEFGASTLGGGGA
jgi:hypothetical protein